MVSRETLTGGVAFELVRRHGLPLLEARRLRRYPWLVHAFTTRWRRQAGEASERGSSNEFHLSYRRGIALAVVEENRQRLLATLSRGCLQLVTLRQLHSDVIRVVERRPGRGARELAGDALVTSQPGLLLATQVADCLPILLVDPKQRIVANVHAGWYGTLRRISEKTVGVMGMRFACSPARLLAIIGPGIHRCCYTVGQEVYERYQGQFAACAGLFVRDEPSSTQTHWQLPVKPTALPGAAGVFFLDLVEANRRQLLAAGLRRRNISAALLCTRCRNDLFFSHRAEGGGAGRMMGVIGMVPGHD